VQELREVMVKEFVQPYEHLVIQLSHVDCKFCDKKLSIPLEFITPEDEMIRTCDAEEEKDT
jgi:hypothetical protein